MKTCPHCKEEKEPTLDNFYFQHGRAHGQCKICTKRPEQMEYRRQWSIKCRLAAIEKYGGSCACCGEETLEFLGIDHVYGGGNKHRKELTEQGITIYIFLKRNDYPDGYQLLCHNCNLAKGYYGQCPHQLNHE